MHKNQEKFRFREAVYDLLEHIEIPWEEIHEAIRVKITKEDDANRYLYEKILVFYLRVLKFLDIQGMDDDSHCEDFLNTFWRIRYRVCFSRDKKIERFGPVFFYMYLKINGVLISIPKLVQLYPFHPGDFQKVLKKIIMPLYPEYVSRDKKAITMNYITFLMEKMTPEKVEKRYIYAILSHFYPHLQTKKEEFIAAVACSLILIAHDPSQVDITRICKITHVTRYNLNRIFLDIIFPYLHIPKDVKLNPSQENDSFRLLHHALRRLNPVDEHEYKFPSPRRKKSPEYLYGGISLKREDYEDIHLFYRQNIYRSYIKLDWNLSLGQLVGSTNPEVEPNHEEDRKVRFIMLRHFVRHESFTPSTLSEKETSRRDRINEFKARKEKIKKIIENHEKPITPRISCIYMSYRPVVQLFDSILLEIKEQIEKEEHTRKTTPISKSSLILLENEGLIKERIAVVCRVLSQINKPRSARTILGIVFFTLPKIIKREIASILKTTSHTIDSNYQMIQECLGKIPKDPTLSVIDDWILPF